ncbi:MAG TPA: universal stress protein [Gemmatimonadaceae bacterium]
MAAAFAELAGGKVRIVRVFDPRHEPRGEVAESVRGATSRFDAQADVAERRLGTVADRLCAEGATAEVRILESRDPGTTILEAMHNENVDFVAMTTRGEGGLQRMVRGMIIDE